MKNGAFAFWLIGWPALFKLCYIYGLANSVYEIGAPIWSPDETFTFLLIWIFVGALLYEPQYYMQRWNWKRKAKRDQ